MAARKKPAAKKRAASKKPAAKKSAPKKRAAKKPTAKKSAAARKTTRSSRAPETTRVPAAAQTATGQLPERKRSRLPILLAGLMAIVAAVIVVIVIAGGDDDNNPTSVAESISTPTEPTITETLTTPTTPATTVPVTPPAAAQPNGDGSVTECEPVFGNGQPYPVSASGTPPPDCTRAHNVALTSLSNNQTQVGNWKCTITLDAPKALVCKSGSQTIVARQP